jgi:hypothetical protein
MQIEDLLALATEAEVEAQPEVEATVEEAPAEPEATVEAEEVPEVEAEPEVVAKPKPFAGWGMAPKRDLLERVKDAAIAAGAEVEQVISDTDVADDDEPKVIHDRKPTDRETKFNIMDEVIAANPELNDTAALVALAEEVYGGEMFAEAGKKYWMNKRLEAAGRAPTKGGTRAKDKPVKAVKVPAFVQAIVKRDIGETAIITKFDEDAMILVVLVDNVEHTVNMDLTLTVTAE